MTEIQRITLPWRFCVSIHGFHASVPTGEPPHPKANPRLTGTDCGPQNPGTPKPPLEALPAPPPPPPAARSFLLLEALAVAFFFSDEAAGIDCFKCVSVRGRNPSCDDPFHNNHSLALLEAPCMGGRKHRDGLFPATSCIKIAGVFDDTGERLTVRGCALDSGTLTTDTEIIRMSHCGKFYYDERYVHGCLQSCNDADACNAAMTSRSVDVIALVFGVLISFGMLVGLLAGR